MPWGQETVVRFWCPLGEECGKKNRHFKDDAANRKAALLSFQEGSLLQVSATFDER
jgi:hypothetical protein